MRHLAAAIILACLALPVVDSHGAGSDAPPPPPAMVVDPDGTAHFPALTVPFSIFASEEARKAYVDRLSAPPWAFGPDQDIGVLRRKVTEIFTPYLDRATALYPVTIEPTVIAGVNADVVTPRDGVSKQNQNRVLVELHNGGFLNGAGIMAKLESVPIAATGGFKVVAVDYRQGPEFKFPAATEDVVKVYKALLTTYRPRNIGIYGCSAGGFLTAETIALLEKEHLPLPGAIGIFCASAGGWSGGDSTYLAAPFERGTPPASSAHDSVTDVSYFSDVDMKDPAVSPVFSPEILARFPPTLVITGTRDTAMSAAIHTHAELVKQGVDADLHVWDGVGHGFFLDARFPESKEAYAVIVRFFDRHLGK
jgi:acetyl esterase/lipase